MEQSRLQQSGPATDISSAPAWQTENVLRGHGIRTTAPAPAPANQAYMQPSTPTGAAHADRSSIVSFFNAQSYRANNGLPPNGLPSTTPSMMMGGANYHGGFPNHFDYSRLSDGHQMLSQDDKNLNGDRAWPMLMHSNMALRHAAERSEVPELAAGPSTVSPSSTFFSGLSNHDLGFPSTPKQDHAVWPEYESESPTVIKQSSSVMNSPTFPQSMPFPGDNSMHAGMSMPQSGPFCNTPWAGQSAVNGYGMSIDNLKLPWNASMRPNGNMGQIDWPQSLMPQDQRSKNAMYHTLRSAPSNQQTSSNDDSNRRQSAANQAVIRSREAPRPNEVVQGISGRISSDDQRQRQRQDDILRQGKADGLTYKEIRALIGTDIAESTLRGRWRSLSKLKRDRVRKPIWTTNDLRLLAENVTQQLSSIPDSRATDRESRLNKVSWKRVSEYIRDNGGSYSFGNATCKKKWIELNSAGD